MERMNEASVLVSVRPSPNSPPETRPTWSVELPRARSGGGRHKTSLSLNVVACVSRAPKRQTSAFEKSRKPDPTTRSSASTFMGPTAGSTEAILMSLFIETNEGPTNWSTPLSVR